MGIPSIATLQTIPGVDRDKAKTIRGLLEGKLAPRDVSPACDRWVRACLHDPSTHEQVIAACDEVIGGSGVEALTDEEHPSDYTDGGIRFCPLFSYVNLGEPYLATLMRDHKRGAWIVRAWGDIAERWGG